MTRLDDLLDDEETADDFPWSDSWRWAPPDTELPEGVWLDEPDDDEPPDGGGDWYPDTQWHAIPADQVAEWERWLETLPQWEREGIDWYVVCHRHKAAGDRSVSCGCG